MIVVLRCLKGLSPYHSLDVFHYTFCVTHDKVQRCDPFSYLAKMDGSLHPDDSIYGLIETLVSLSVIYFSGIFELTGEQTQDETPIFLLHFAGVL